MTSLEALNAIDYFMRFNYTSCIKIDDNGSYTFVSGEGEEINSYEVMKNHVEIIRKDLKRIEELELKLQCRNHEIRVLKKKLKGKMKDEIL